MYFNRSKKWKSQQIDNIIIKNLYKETIEITPKYWLVKSKNDVDRVAD